MYLRIPKTTEHKRAHMMTALKTVEKLIIARHQRRSQTAGKRGLCVCVFVVVFSMCFWCNLQNKSLQIHIIIN